MPLNRLVPFLLVFFVCAALPPVSAQTPAPTIPIDASQSPVVQALEAEFLVLWPVLLRGDFKRGLPDLESLLERCQAQLGETALTTLKVQYFLGSSLHRVGRIADAKEIFASTLMLHDQAGTQDSRSALSSLAALARAVEDLESPRAALQLYERAMAQRSRTVGDDDLESVTLVDDYAGALVEVGEVHAALPLLDQVLQMRIKGLGPTHRWTLTTLNNRANAFSRLGRFSESLVDSETVLQHRLKELGERDATTLVAMSNTGVALANAGRVSEALMLHERAAALRSELLGRNHPSTLTTRRALADDLLDLGRIGEARSTLQELAEQGKAAWGPTHRHTLSARVSLARSHQLLADLPAALVELDALQALHRQVHGEGHFDTLSVAIQHARVLRLVGQPDKAREVLERLLPIVVERYGTRMPIYSEGLAELAACLLDSGLESRAAAALAQLLGDPSLSSDIARSKAGDVYATPTRKEEWQRLLTRALAKQGRLKEAFAVIETQKSERLLAALNERAAAGSAGVARLDISQLQDHRERVVVLRDAVRSARLPQDRLQAIQELDRAVLARQVFQTELRHRHPLFGKLTHLPAAAVEDASRLPPQALLVSFVVEGSQSINAFTLDSKGRLQWHMLGQRQGLGQSVESLRLWAMQLGNRRLADDQGRVVQIMRWEEGGYPRWRPVSLHARSCENPAESPDCRPAGARAVDSRVEYDALRQHLANLLLAPMEARLKKHPHWVISPDGGLGTLPFDILPWQGSIVAEHKRVSYAQSLSALKAVRQHQQARNEPSIDLIAIGSPALDQEPKATPAGPRAVPQPWPPLPAAALEIRSAAAQFPVHRTVVAFGLAATESHLRSLSITGDLAKARYVLLATHAWYDSGSPGRSHLALGAVSAAPNEDGQMTATELAGLVMRSELTVVSACNTARGESTNSEGQFGFAYGLNVAGNRNALLTLWPIGDQSSAAFVSRFFHHLASSRNGHTEALYATKREFMKHPRPAWRHPRVWAGFTLFGT